MSSNDQEFFIGWEGKAPPRTGRFLSGLVLGGLALTVGLAAALPALQRTLSGAWFEFGTTRQFTGLLLASPAPMLLADEPDEASGQSVYFLVNPLKYGFDPEVADALHLKRVRLEGTLIWHEEGGAMIEVVKGSATPVEGTPGAPLEPAGAPEEVDLVGEIVDSKCWLGVMNPGTLKPHRACAIHCIRGGIPPMLLVDRRDLYLMVGPDGEAIHDEVLEHVAIPVRVPGKVVDYGSIQVLHLDPAEIRPTGL